jgi:hypothetical protein
MAELSSSTRVVGSAVEVKTKQQLSSHLIVDSGDVVVCATNSSTSSRSEYKKLDMGP